MAGTNHGVYGWLTRQMHRTPSAHGDLHRKINGGVRIFMKNKNKPNHPKNQHYVPKFLLRNFSINQKDQIYCYDKTSGRIFQSNVRNQASEKAFYDLFPGEQKASLESHLSGLESTCSYIINDKIIKRGTIRELTPEDHGWLSLFIAIQYLRTKNARCVLKQMDEDVSQRIRDMGGDPSTVNNYTEIKGEEELKMFSMLNLSIAREFIPHILNKKWILFRSDKKFWISDNPVVLQNTTNVSEFRGTLGFAVDGIEIYLPICPSLVLGFFCRKSFEAVERDYKMNQEMFDECRRLQLRNYVVKIRREIPLDCISENVTNLNSLQVAFAERFVYSNTDNFELASEMIDNNDKISKGPRMKFM